MADRNENLAETIRDLTNSASGREMLDYATGCYAVVPEGYSIRSLEHLQSRPNRSAAAIELHTGESLVDYVTRYAKPGTSVFADPGDRSMLAVLDYHTPDEPAHCEHRACLWAIRSFEYAQWAEISGQALSQKGAGEFLEERALDIVEPEAADIFEMVMKFDALKKVTFKQSTRLQSGLRQFLYHEEDEARGSVTLPEMLKITVPIFEGEDPTTIPIRIRYRIDNDGRLTFAFKIADRKALEDRAFLGMVDAVAGKLPAGVAVYRGSMTRAGTSS